MKEKIRVETVLSWTNCILVSGNIKEFIYCISTDSRTIKKGDFFIPLKGNNYDGSDFIVDALRRGAAGFVFESGLKGRLKSFKENSGAVDFDDLLILQSENNLVFLEKIASGYIKKFKPTVIGITGSVGKTTTKDFLTNILAKKRRVVFTPANYNTEVGVAKSIFNIDKKTEFFIAELGMRAKGQIKVLSEICDLNIGAITRVGESHLAFFKDLKEIAEAKAEMAEILRKNDGVLFLNNDDRSSNMIEEMAGCRVIRFGRNNKLAFNFLERSSDIMGRFAFDFYQADKKVTDMTLSIPGYHNIYNACCAAAISAYLNMDKDDIKKGIEQADMQGSRMEIVRKNNRIIMNDCYNASPISTREAVSTLVLISEKNNMRSVAILGDMLELGDGSPMLHYEIGRYLSEKKVDMLIAVGRLAENIYNGFRSGSNFNKRRNLCFYFKNKKELGRKLSSLLKSEDLILLKGSRANKMEDIINII
jgi:UDP-N-acetylmuramoyl-tripeptide--D-alanyl-D-alanine ligase